MLHYLLIALLIAAGLVLTWMAHQIVRNIIHLPLHNMGSFNMAAVPVSMKETLETFRWRGTTPCAPP